MMYSDDKSIAIRSIEESDLPLVQSWRNNYKISRYFREYREFSMIQEEQWYNDMIVDNRFEMFVIVDCISDEVIGVTGLTYIDWVNRHADVHFYIGKDEVWIDKKYAPKAIEIIIKYGFGILNLNKVWAEVYEIDKLKLIFLKKTGFNIDANLREHYFYQGKYYTSHILSLLRSDYSK
jgi:RimJ/RimL family protein N-acetyltransferase